MKKQYFFLFFFNISFFYTQISNPFMFNNSYYYYIKRDIYMKNPEIINYTNLKNYTVSSFFIDREEGNLHWGQQAKKSTNFGFKSEGIVKDKKILLFGNVIIRKEYQEDVKWNLSFIDVKKNLLFFNYIENPTYYAVSKKSNWNNQFYSFKGGLQFKLIKNIDLTVYGNYNLKEKFRSQFDPRINTCFNELKLNGGLTVSLSKNNKLILSCNYGYFDVESNIKYSDIYQNIPLNYKTYQKWISGYGTLINRTNDKINRKNNNSSLKLGYLINKGNSLFFAKINFDNSITDNYKNYSFKKNYIDILSIYNYKKRKIDILFNKKIRYNSEIIINFKGKYTNGINFLNINKGINYKLIQHNYYLNFSYLKPNKNKYYNLGGDINYLSLLQIDYLSSTSQYNKGIIFSSYYIQKFNGRKISMLPFICVDYKLILDSMFTNANANYRNKNNSYKKLDFAGKTLKLFYDEVLYHDYSIASKSLAKLKIGVHFIKKYKNKTFGLNFSQSCISNFIKRYRIFSNVTFTIQY